MIIDTHQHFWQYSASEYGWIDESMSILKKNYLPEDLAPHLVASDVEGTVAVQARQLTSETRWLLDLADDHPFIRGVVGWVDLLAEDLDDSLAEFSVHPKLAGVRHVIHDEPDDDFLLRPDFMRGIKTLAKHKLAYDLLLFPKHLSAAISLIQRFPGQKFVLDHLAKPMIRAGTLDPWRQDIRILAGHPNVWCKISGMVTEADHEHWKPEDFIPYLDVVMEAFGAERLMLGSDWPVCRLAAEYDQVIGIAGNYLSGLDALSKEKIYRLNAIEFYNLEGR